MPPAFSNCDSDLPQFACDIGNVAGYVSTCMWFLVLVPQLIRNHLRRSVEGLSVLWASANATASFCNLFFVFTNSLPLYVRIMAVYMPVLEVLMLLQFFSFYAGDHSRRLTFAVALCSVWALTIAVGFLGGDLGRSVLQWFAVILWSVECFPQLFLNMEKFVCGDLNFVGQSPFSIGITVFGKTTDALGALLLTMPRQTIVLAYFSSSLAWINAAEILVFPSLSSVGNLRLVCRNPLRSFLLLGLLVLLCGSLIGTFLRLGWLSLAMPSLIVLTLSLHWMFQRCSQIYRSPELRHSLNSLAPKPVGPIEKNAAVLEGNLRGRLLE